MFAGIGGFRSGLSHYGDFFVPVGYCEIDPYAKRAYEAIYEPKGEIYFEDARGIVPENLPDIDLICGVISEFGEPNSVRVFQSLESEGALKMPEERCSLKSLGLPALKDLAFSSLKTFPDSYRMTGAGRLRPSSVSKPRATPEMKYVPPNSINLEITRERIVRKARYRLSFLLS